MYENIIVPLDGSDASRQVLPYARSIAKTVGATLHLIGVLEPLNRVDNLSRMGSGAQNAPMSQSELVLSEDWRALVGGLRREARERLDAAAEESRNRGIETTVELLEGEAAEQIIAAGNRQGESLIAMSTHGRSGIGRWMLGSVTDKVVKHTSTPVLIIRAQREEPPDDVALSKVVLPLDGSELAERAIPHAVAFANAFGAGITILRSSSPTAYGFGYADYYAAQTYTDISSEVLSDVRDYVTSAVGRIQGMGVASVEERTPEGNPGAAIIDEVGDDRTKLVVMTTHGRTGVGRWVLGSVTDRVIQHSAGPVMVIASK